MSQATTTSASGSATPSSTTGPSPFFAIKITLSIGIEVYVSANGTLVADITLAAAFQIVGEELFQVTGEQRIRRRALAGQIEAAAGADRALIAPNTAGGILISTEFIFTGFGQELVWDNAAFFGGSAGYCIINDALYATLVEDTSFCDQLAAAIIVPLPTAGSSTSSGAVAPTSGPSTTIINNYNNVTIYNNVEYNFNININIEIFEGGNYKPCDAESFYARLCPVCPPVKVFKSDLTYAELPCPVCPPEVFKIASCPEQQSGSGPSNTTYGPVSCLSCKAPPPQAKQPLAVVAAPCPVCPGSTTNIVVPSSAASSILQVASSQGPAAAASAAKSAITLTITQTVAPSAPALPASTVANVPCPTCPAGSVAVTLPQVAATAAAPVQPSSGLTPPVAAFKGAASLTAPLTTGFILISSFVAVIIYL